MIEDKFAAQKKFTKTQSKRKNQEQKMSDDNVERRRVRAYRLVTKDFNGDGAKLAVEAADEITRLRAQLHSEIVSHADMQKAYEVERDTLREQLDRLRETLTTCTALLEKLASDMCPPNSTTPQLLMLVGVLRQALK